MKACNRYELRRYRDGQRDPSFNPAYSDVGWATAIAHEYAEPGATIEVWDAQTREAVAYISPPAPDTGRGDQDPVPSVPGGPAGGAPPDLATEPIPSAVGGLPGDPMHLLPG